MTKWIAFTSTMLLFSGCAKQQLPAPNPAAIYAQQLPEPQPPLPPQELLTPAPTKVAAANKPLPPKPKKVHKLKKVEDTNFNPDYMYPEAKKPKTVKKVTPKIATPALKTASATMTRAKCIEMLGAEKFERYTQMLGGEAGAIKRCTMLQSMQ